MPDEMIVQWVREKFEPLKRSLNERCRRLWAAAEARARPGRPGARAALGEPTARGDPEQPLRWTCKSTYRLANELRKQGFQVGPRTVAKELKGQQFSLQSNRKTREGTSHPDRNEQFAYINRQVMAFQRRGQPAVSGDTQKEGFGGGF